MPRTVVKGRYFRRYPVNRPLGHAEKEFALGPEDAAFVLVDVYGEGLDEPPGNNPGHSGDAERVPIEISTKRKIIREHLAPALQAARSAGFPIIYVSNSAPRVNLADSTYSEQKWDTLQLDKDKYFAEEGVDPREYHAGAPEVLRYSKNLAPREGDYYVRKHVHSGFFDTRLDTLLRNLGVKNLVFVGFALDECVGTTMIDALWRNYRVILLRDCTYASEIATIDKPGMWTARWILYTECSIGYTTTSDEWVQACSRLSQD